LAASRLVAGGEVERKGVVICPQRLASGVAEAMARRMVLETTLPALSGTYPGWSTICRGGVSELSDPTEFDTPTFVPTSDTLERAPGRLTRLLPGVSSGLSQFQGSDTPVIMCRMTP